MKTCKRIVTLLLALTMLLSMVACGAPAMQAPKQEQLEVENVVPAQTEAATEAETEAAQQPAEETQAAQESVPVENSNGQAVPSVENLSNNTGSTEQPKDVPQQNDAEQSENVPAQTVTPVAPEGEYNEGIVLVKVEDSFRTEDLGELSYTAAEPLYTGSKWYTVQLTEAGKTVEAVTYLTNRKTFAKVDYDYIMQADAETESAQVTDNPNYAQQTNLGVHNIPYGWTQNGKHPGGSPDVIVAVIDTGVDYNHVDLRNNIWVNAGEIAGNGRDDDNNGYIDDVYGWDCVGDDHDPMDDNGHGTHVAGIIAAENNKVGGIGVAYNCKVMVLKAGNSSGYFNNSDIAEAIQYAYMNGASVINMSFGGKFISTAAEEALENAYNQCILVAAAGNDSRCNQPGCMWHVGSAPSYPAALPYVIGVMSANAAGTGRSGFSNFDHYPYNGLEYEVFAVGEAVKSTWPNNKYATLNGTSMAAPTVSGIAALLRSALPDREMYATKYIQSQIVNTNTDYLDSAHSIVDLEKALNTVPTPKVKLYDYRIDDSTSISEKNNGNGVIDAGETVRLYISLYNRGGVAIDVNVSVDTMRNNDPALTDPYFTFTNNVLTLSDIGTYSVRDAYENEYIEITVSPNCPNDYIVDFNIRYTYKNGMDEKDKTVYTDDGEQKAQFNVSRGFYLPATITEDTVYTADRLYIVSRNVIIPDGVTVIFEEGCQIQFYADKDYYDSPMIYVYGTLKMKGSAANMIEIFPSERYLEQGYGCVIYNYSTTCLDYVEAMNFVVSTEPTDGSTAPETHITNSFLRQKPVVKDRGYRLYTLKNGSTNLLSNYALHSTWSSSYIPLCVYENNYIENFAGAEFDPQIARNNFIVHITGNYGSVGTGKIGDDNGEFSNNIVYSYSIDAVEGCYFRAENSSSFYGEVSNNYFINADGTNAKNLLSLRFYSENEGEVCNNYFSDGYKEFLDQVINDYYDTSGNPTVDVFTSLSDASKLWPYVVSVELFDKDGDPITRVGKEEIKVRVTFNRPMDTTKDTFVTFGTIEPYADYRINGSYVSSTVWEGTYTLKAEIENGQNFLKVNNACAAEDPTKTVFGEYQLHEFTIDTTAAMAMNLQAVALDNGIQLTFAQDDYDTLLGYNIYRSEDKDGNFVKLNPTIVLPEEETFLDDNAEPGKTYWYTYTVVLSDFTESNPAGKVQATAKDTMAPSVYHTPVNQGYESNNLVISCTASDNVGIQTVTLYYRAVGADAWKSLTMSKQNDKYSATIFGSDVTLAGLEYYIVAADGVNTVNKGSAEAPYTIIVKSADSLLGKGDVDGNGQVTTKDALMLMQCLEGNLLLADDAFQRADLNGDKVLSAAEALKILQYVNGKVTDLTM